MSEAMPHCSVCGDEAVPAVVRSLDRATATAQVEICAEPKTVALDLVDAVQVGDTILVHQGFAIARLEAP